MEERELITDEFLNSCFVVLLCKTKIRKNKNLFHDIKQIIKYYLDREDIPIIMKNKVECLQTICEMKIDGKNEDNIIDSLAISRKYDTIIDFIKSIREDDIKDDVLVDHIKQIRLRKKLNLFYRNLDLLNSLINKAYDHTFESLDDLVIRYENVIKSLHNDIVEQNRDLALEASSSLDLVKDNFECIISKILDKYEQTSTTPTGFPIFDTYILRGGFEPSRLYVFAGTSGSGKSTLLLNLITNSIMHLQGTTNRSSIDNVYIYITLENTIEEALLRMYQSLFSKTTGEAISDIKSKVNFKEMILNKLQNNSTIIMKYFPAATISCSDIMIVLDEVIEQYGKGKIRGLYLDYLDLLRTDVKYDINWIEIGHIALDLKTLAVRYEIPVITATHLKSSSYDLNDVNSLSLNLMSKSIQKIEHADFVSMQFRDKNDDNVVYMKIGKNRSNKSNISLIFEVDFERYTFINGRKNDRMENKHILDNLNEITVSNNFLLHL